MRIALRLLPGIVVTGLLAACVTESTGGFTPGSREEALSNYLQLSRGYLQQGDLENARFHLSNALDIDPRNSEAYGIRALLFTRQGDRELAEQSFRRAISLDRGNTQVRNNYAAFLYAQKRYGEAFDQLSEVVKDTQYRLRAQAFESLGFAALRMDRASEAENAFARALQLNPNLPAASLELADINLERDNVLQARAFYRNYLTLQQLENRGPAPRGLWVGIKLERALGNDRNVEQYARVLEEQFRASGEYELYQRSLNHE